MPDLRYHLFYFIAIFLMLGVGMLVGGSFYGPAQVRQQQKSLANLRVQVDGAVQDGRQAKAELAATEAALEGVRLPLVRGKLSGRGIILVQTGDYPAATQAAAGAVQDAGGQVSAIVIVALKWQGQADDARRQNAAGLACALVGTASPSPVPALQTLEERGLVTVSGTINEAPGASLGMAFVLVGGGTDDAPPDADLLSALHDAAPSATVVGVEPFGAGVSSIPAFQSAGASSVDCVDRPLGKLALPFAVRGGSDAGDYGLKPTARLTVPPSLPSGAASHA